MRIESCIAIRDADNSDSSVIYLIRLLAVSYAMFTLANIFIVCSPYHLLAGLHVAQSSGARV
jgi:hypothetical protein